MEGIYTGTTGPKRQRMEYNDPRPTLYQPPPHPPPCPPSPSNMHSSAIPPPYTPYDSGLYGPQNLSDSTGPHAYVQEHSSHNIPSHDHRPHDVSTVNGASQSDQDYASSVSFPAEQPHPHVYAGPNPYGAFNPYAFQVAQGAMKPSSKASRAQQVRRERWSYTRC